MTDLNTPLQPQAAGFLRAPSTGIMLAVSLALAGCVPGGSSGDGGGSSGGGTGTSGASCPVVGTDGGCNGSCSQTDAGAFLTVADVNTIMNQALAEANAIGGAAATTSVAVVDRVGNVLGVKTLGAPGQTVTVDSAPLAGGGPGTLENVAVPATAAAIAKAITGAYLSSEGNAFSTRTANFIVQDHYPAGVDNVPGGPLFGVQFSQLPCSDLTTDSTFDGTVVTSLGPHRSPLGLAADPGGLPLYKNGALVGGVGAIGDGVYGIDRNVLDVDSPAVNIDERIALAGSRGFEAPADRRADRITVDGILLPFSDATIGQLDTVPPAAPIGALEAVPLFFDGTVRAGTRFTTLESGFRPADDNFVAGGPGASTLDAFVLTDGVGANRFLPTGGALLSVGEVSQLLRNALTIANRSFGQIRRPLCSQARVTVSVVDTNGDILGIARTRDAPVFGTDVSLQKARSALFFSSADTEAALDGIGLATDYPAQYALFAGAATLNGNAFGARSIGNLSRPFFPDGINANRNGPFGEPLVSWSPFNTGLQSLLVTNGFVGGGLADANACTLPGVAGTRLRNGLQIFSGGVPIYKGGVLAGAIGASGDGIEQDDMIVFLGLHEAGQALGGAIGNAAPGIRIDQVDFTVRDLGGTATGTTRIRYVQCPFQPFIGSEESNPCNGK
jgi:uncharacterized protein GlcG (DUF336 family)